MGTAIPELSLEIPGGTRRFPVKPSVTGLSAGGCCRGQTLALGSQGNVSQCRSDEETNVFSYGEQKGQERGTGTAAALQRGQWVSRKEFTAVIVAWDSKSCDMGQGSECWHQLEQDMAGMVFYGVPGFYLLRNFPLAPRQCRNPSMHMLPIQRVLRCWSHAWSLWVTLLWDSSLCRAHGKLPVQFSLLVSGWSRRKYFQSSAIAEAVACCLNLLMEFSNDIFQLNTIIIIRIRCMIV